MNLQGALLNVVRVYVIRLEMAKPKFAGRDVVGIRRQIHNGNIEIPQYCLSLGRGVIGGPIKEEDGVAPPVGTLPIKFLNELM